MKRIKTQTNISRVKSALRFLFCIFITTNTVNAQVNPIIPGWINKLDIKSIGQVNKKQVKNGFYYILVDEQHNTIKKQSYFHYAVSALNEEALVDVSQIEFSYDPTYEKAYLHDIKVYRGSEVINKINASFDLKVLNEENERNNGLLNGEKTLYANLSDVRKGDIVEYSYSIVGKNPVMADYFNFDFRLSYSAPVGKVHYRVIFAKHIIPSVIKNTNLEPRITAGDVNDYVWDINNPPVVTVESSTPSWYKKYDRVQISNLKSWLEVKEHFKTLLKVQHYNTAGIKRIVDSITRITTDPEARITAAITFVQNHVRYSGNENGIYSHVPRTPDFVLKNRFGDCKEKSMLLTEMLRRMDISTWPVLVNTSLGEKVKERNPSINTFNHCIVGFLYNNKMYFVDPTVTYQRGNFKLRIVPGYETGMVLNDEPSAFENIPTDLSSITKIKEEFIIGESGDTELKVTTIATGTDADDVRYYFLTNSLYGIQESYKKFYHKFTEDIDVTDTVSYVDNEEKNEFIVYENYRLNKFWTVADSNKSRVIEKEFIPYSLNYKLNYGEELKRTDPLQVSFPVNHSQTITICKSGGWNVEFLKKEENNNYFNYQYLHSVKENTLSLIYNYTAKTGLITPGNYQDYKSRMDFINNNMVFSAVQTPLADGTIGFNWPLFTALLTGLLLSAILLWYLYRLRHYSDYESRYDSIGGWLVFVGIGMIVNPLSLLYGIYNECYEEMGINYAAFYFNETSSYFAPLKGYFTLFVAFVNTLMFCFSIMLAILFYQKKAVFRWYYAFFRIFNVLFLIFDVIVLYSIYGDSTDTGERAMLSKETSALFRVLFQSCIWVPYVWFSERSRHTFTNGTSGNKNEALIKNNVL